MMVQALSTQTLPLKRPIMMIQPLGTSTTSTLAENDKHSP